MDIAEATGQDIIRTISGLQVRAKRLTMRDVGELATRKQQAEAGILHVQVQGLVDAGVKQDQLPAVIKELTKSPSYPEIVRWAFTTEGALAILNQAGVDAGNEDELGEYHFLALDCMGIEYETESVDDEAGSIPFSNSSPEAVT